jgi:hypothetical protein
MLLKVQWQVARLRSANIVAGSRRGLRYADAAADKQPW